MTELLIGTGGWAYFQVPGLESLEAYAKAFDFVEVNSTFYEIPGSKMVKSWRQRVPTDFEFSVRCHRSVTHKYKLEPVKEAIESFKVMTDICRILDSRFLVLETPPTLDFTHQKVESARNLLESVDLTGITVVWEARRKRGEPVPSGLVTLMKNYGVVNCVDLSKAEPPPESKTVYSRLFGRGEHNVYQFTDEELTEIDEKITRRNAETTAVSFHNVRMYKDAARYKIFRQTGRLPSVTKARGHQSLREVLLEDGRFPATRQELIEKQGWKVIDLTEKRRVHARVLLEKLPDQQFRNIEEVLSSLPRV